MSGFIETNKFLKTFPNEVFKLFEQFIKSSITDAVSLEKHIVITFPAPFYEWSFNYCIKRYSQLLDIIVGITEKNSLVKINHSEFNPAQKRVFKDNEAAYKYNIFDATFSISTYLESLTMADQLPEWWWASLNNFIIPEHAFELDKEKMQIVQNVITKLKLTDQQITQLAFSNKSRDFCYKYYNYNISYPEINLFNIAATTAWLTFLDKNGRLESVCESLFKEENPATINNFLMFFNQILLAKKITLKEHPQLIKFLKSIYNKVPGKDSLHYFNDVRNEENRPNDYEDVVLDNMTPSQFDIFFNEYPYDDCIKKHLKTLAQKKPDLFDDRIKNMLAAFASKLDQDIRVDQMGVALKQIAQSVPHKPLIVEMSKLIQARFLEIKENKDDLLALFQEASAIFYSEQNDAGEISNIINSLSVQQREIILSKPMEGSPLYDALMQKK